jgi:hypothetical protein
MDIPPEGIPQTNDRLKWWAAFFTSGGICVILVWVMVNSMLKEARESQIFLRTQFIAEMKNNATSNAVAAKAMEDAATAMRDQVRTQNDVSNALKDLSRDSKESIKELQRTQEDLSKSIKSFIEKEGEPPNAPDD